MNRNTIIALIVAAIAAIATLVMCSRQGEQAAGTAATPSPAAIEAAPIDRTPAAPDMAVGDTCAVDCAGTPVTITCAEGEKPVCDCAATPRTQCLPPAATP